MVEQVGIFIVEDEALIAADIAVMLRGLGYRVAGTAVSGNEALAKIGQTMPDLVLMDIVLSDGLDGIEVAEQLKARYDLPVVFLTAYADALSLQHAKITSPYGYVLKPFTERDLQIAIDIALYRHHTDRQMRAQMRQLERVRAALDQMNDALIMAAADGTVLYVNKAFETMIGLSTDEVVGSNIHTDPRLQSEPALHRTIWETVISGKSWSGSFTATTKDNQPIEIEATITPVFAPDGVIDSFIGISRDVTHERALERQLRHAQKLEAVGTLASGIAHDFNNILTAIIGYTELASIEAPAGSKQATNLANVLKAADRARNLVRQILTFSRRGEQTFQPVHLAALVKETLKLLRAAIPTTIEIKTAFSAMRDSVLGDPTQLHQMLMNLCINAADAMAGKPGTLTVELAEKPELGADHAAALGLKQQEYVMLSVADTGCGIPEEILDRIFDPFFTTKEEGKGTGLGLSVVHGIVKNHNGAITVDSISGKGTRFTVYLPLFAEQEAQVQAAPVELRGGSGRVLLVDDEQAIVDVGRQLLTQLGYTVTGLTDPYQALELFRSNPTSFDVIITDYTMPRLAGDALIREIRTLRQDVPIVLCTGYSDRISHDDARAMGAQELAFKPLSQATYAEVVSKVMGKK